MGEDVESQDVAILGETLSLFDRFWLTITLPLPESIQAAAKAKGSGGSTASC